MSKLTNAEVTRISLLAEPERRSRLLDPRINLEAVVQKARFLESEALAANKPEAAERYDELIESAAVLEPESKYPDAIVKDAFD